MKYEVEVERKSYISVEVEAHSEEEAQAKAVQTLTEGYPHYHAEWTPVNVITMNEENADDS